LRNFIKGSYCGAISKKDRNSENPQICCGWKRWRVGCYSRCRTDLKLGNTAFDSASQHIERSCGRNFEKRN